MAARIGILLWISAIALRNIKSLARADGPCRHCVVPREAAE